MACDRTLIVVPTYNEREALPTLFHRLFAEVPQCDYLVVDDSSPDGTADIAEQLFGNREGFHLMRRPGPRSFGRSYVDGFTWALDQGYPRVIQMDCDLSHDPCYLPEMMRLAESADVVVGSRYIRGGGVRNWPIRRVLLSRFANFYVHLVTGVPVRDATSGYRCYTRDALRSLRLESVRSTGYAFQVEMVWRAHRAGLRIVELPIVFTDRKEGRSKMGGRMITESILLPWRLRLGAAADASPPQRD